MTEKSNAQAKLEGFLSALIGAAVAIGVGATLHLANLHGFGLAGGSLVVAALLQFFLLFGIVAGLLK